MVKEDFERGERSEVEFARKITELAKEVAMTRRAYNDAYKTYMETYRKFTEAQDALNLALGY